MIQVNFVSDQRHERRLSAFKRFGHEVVPVFKILKRLLVGDVVGENDCICLVDVGADHFAEDGLAADVPNLECDVRLFWEFEPFDEEVNSDRLLVAAAELIFAEARDEGRLSDGTIAEDHYFVLKVFGLFFGFLA
jgi:hypothetical protein